MVRSSYFAGAEFRCANAVHVFSASRCLDHDQGANHPEQPARLRTVLNALALAGVEVTTAPAATIDAAATVHDLQYLKRAAALSHHGGGELGADTIVNASSWGATLAATGASLGALRAALADGGNAFAAVRPPGHHALPSRAMGFCIVNHVAVLAAAARAAGRERVLVIDWDVHHGNGTQAMVEHDARTHFVSMHQSPWYPGSGATDERGVGNCFNLPMQAALPPAVYVESLWRGIMLATTAWVPDVILVSAGFDAMRGDPLGGFTLEPAHYAEWVRRLRDVGEGLENPVDPVIFDAALVIY